MEDCIFCKITKGELPSTKVYEDDKVLAFKDINPVTPVHVILIPKKHIVSVNEITEDDTDLIAHIFMTIKKIAKDLDIAKSGYRVITNAGKDAGQTVPHLHFHILGKKDLGEKLI